MVAKDETTARVGRPNVQPGEDTTRIGPFAVGSSTADWFREIASRLGMSQGDCFREALRAYKRSVARRLKRAS